MAFDTDNPLQLRTPAEFFEMDLDRLSALELVEMIEQEEQIVEEFERKLELGACALMHRITNFKVEQQDADAEHSGNVQSSKLIDELHAVIDQLEAMTDHLEHRSTTLDQQEIAQADLAAMLLEAQMQLANRVKQAENSRTEESRHRRQRVFRRAA